MSCGHPAYFFGFFRGVPVEQPLGGAEDARVGVDVEHGLRVAGHDGVGQLLAVDVLGLEGGHAREGLGGLAHRGEVDRVQGEGRVVVGVLV